MPRPKTLAGVDEEWPQPMTMETRLWCVPFGPCPIREARCLTGIFVYLVPAQLTATLCMSEASLMADPGNPGAAL